MQSHTHAHLHVFRPGVNNQRMQAIYRCRYSIRGASKCYEESISLRIDLVTIPFLKYCPQ
jgi:hypothetical protein